MEHDWYPLHPGRQNEVGIPAEFVYMEQVHLPLPQPPPLRPESLNRPNDMLGRDGRDIPGYGVHVSLAYGVDQRAFSCNQETWPIGVSIKSIDEPEKRVGRSGVQLQRPISVVENTAR